ncbi:MAG: AAA family ATPase [Gemmataceae bacterium]
MLLASAKVGPFKSINQAQTVAIDDHVTVLVGMNEAGKTVFLQALDKSNDALGLAKFDPVEDYPRKDLPAYLKQHKTQPATVTELTYSLDKEEIDEINNDFATELKAGFRFAIHYTYGNTRTISLKVDEKPVLKNLAADDRLSSDAVTGVKKATTLRGIPEALKAVALTDGDKEFLGEIEERIKATKWDSVVSSEVFEWVDERVPKFVYFGEYELLPSKVNLADLAQRVQSGANDPKILKPEHRAILALLRMADIAINDFAKPGGYESLKAKIEGVSISLTDQIMEFWKQNEDLEVEIDIKADPDDEAPFNNGSNLYIRIKNRRHRGVSTPFRQRSRGFIWFFSFLVWFDSVRHQLGTKSDDDLDLILLLDEPGLSLHALAQADFLRYITNLAERHQVLYTTHSPFMIDSEKPLQIRMVEDKKTIGTVVSENLSGSDPRTIFPLQAALGWTIAQNLFISKRNLLVEGPSELIYLKALSNALEAQGRTGLRDDVTIVPTGGLDKVVTFVALLGASGLELAVLHDFRGSPEQKISDLVRQKIIAGKYILNASQFRDLAKIGTDGQPSDTEDLFAPKSYLEWFNKAFAKPLKGKVKESELPTGPRIIGRLEGYIASKGIVLRPSGGFNHYTVASYFISNPPAKLDDDTLARFEALFTTVNGLFTR